MIAKYGERVEYLLATQLKGTDCKMVLKIVMLLNYPQWRQETARLIAKCLLLIKDDLNLLSVTELVTLYEVKYTNDGFGLKLIFLIFHSYFDNCLAKAGFVRNKDHLYLYPLFSILWNRPLWLKCTPIWKIIFVHIQ